LLALLALHQGILMLRTHRWSNVAATGVLGGLTALSHPQAVMFLAGSLLILWAFHFRRGRALPAAIQLVAAGLLGLGVASPWLVAVVTAHGLAPILSAGRTALDPGAGLIQLLGLNFVDTPVLDLITALGVLGIVVRVARGQWMIPVWLFLTMVLDPRAGPTFATVPLALSVVPIIGELLQRMVPIQGVGSTLDSEPMPRLLRSHRAVAIVVTLMLFVTGALGALYLAGAAVLGGAFILFAVLNLRDHRRRWSRPLFDYSIAYLALLFGVMVADRMVGKLG